MSYSGDAANSGDSGHISDSGDAVVTEKVQYCAVALGSRDAKIAVAAARHLGALGRKASAAVPELIDALWHRLPVVIAEAANALADVGIASADVLDGLVAVLRRGDPALYPSAIDALLKLDRRHPSFELALLTLLNHSDPKVVADMLAALPAAGCESEQAVAAVARCVMHPDEHVALSACRALASLESRAISAVPVLLDRLENSDPFVAATIVRTLTRIGIVLGDSARAVGTLSRLMRRASVGSAAATTHITDIVAPPGAPVLMDAALLLYEIAKLEDVAVPVLTEALQHEDPRVVIAAAWSLAEIGEPACEASLALLQAVKHPNREVSRQARVALAAVRGDVLLERPVLVESQT